MLNSTTTRWVRGSSRWLGAAALLLAFAVPSLTWVRATRGDPPKADPAPAAAPTAATPAGLPGSIPGNIEVSAEKLEVDTKEQTATLTGKVVLTKGTELSLKCPKIEVRYDGGGPRVSWAKGTGGIVAEVKGVRGEAPEFELDLGKQRLVLRGGVRLFRGQGWVSADGADIDLATARVSMTNVKASLPVGGALKKP